MEVRKPVFLVGLSRGGTNQILNILRSHPATYWPEGEFGEIFRPYPRKVNLKEVRKFLYYLPILVTAGDVIHSTRAPKAPRIRLSQSQRRRVHNAVRSSVGRHYNSVLRFKEALSERQLIVYARPERLFVKLLDYNMALIETLSEMYPEARFVGLIRDGRAVIEGHLARGASLDEAVKLYNYVAERLIGLETSLDGVAVWRFEDVCANPEHTINEMLRFCELDPDVQHGVHMQDKKRVYSENGERVHVEKVSRYLPLSELKTHLRADVNESSIARLTTDQLNTIDSLCKSALEYYGYLA